MAQLDPSRYGHPPPSLFPARRWSFLKLILVVGLPAFWALAILWSQLQPKHFVLLTREDGAIEVLQILILVATAAITSAISWRLWQRKQKRWGLIYAGVTLGLLVMAAEEMSWGQRIRDVAPSAFFDRYNKQGETNLHNLKLIMPAAPHLTSFLLSVLIALSARSWKMRSEPQHRRNAHLWMPSAILLPAWICPASYRAFRTVRSLADVRSTLVLSRLEEPAELILYMGLLGFAVIVLARLHRHDL